MDMEKEEKNRILRPPGEPEFFFQWGSRKRLRCVRVRGANPTEVSSSSDPSSSNLNNNTSSSRRRISSRFLSLGHKDGSFAQPTSRFTRNTEIGTLRSESRKSSSPEKEERYYSTRGSTAEETNGKASLDNHHHNGSGDLEKNHHYPYQSNNGLNNGMSLMGKRMVWPKLCISLSSKEKEEDFMAMKGCKLPQRPKKRAKVIQRTLLLVSPGAWLTDMSLERYEVREKKTSKKRARGLKAMGNMESDSE